MADQTGYQSTNELARQVALLAERLEVFRGSAEGRDDEWAVLLQELESAHEELRVANEEVHAQQEQIRQALTSQHAERLRHERLIAALPVPVIVTDGYGVIRSTNVATVATLNIPLDSLRGKPITTVIEESDRPELRRELSRITRTGQGEFRRLVTLRPRHREPLQAELVATLVRDKERNLTHVTFVVVGVGGPDADGGNALKGRAVAHAFSELTRVPLSDVQTEHVLTKVSDICQRVMGPGTSVSITLGNPTAPELVATTSKLAQDADGRQILAGEGPCVSAWENDEVVWSTDLRHDERWPKFARHVGNLPVHEVAAVPVRGGDRYRGALNIYVQSDARRLGEELPQLAAVLGGAVGAVLEEIAMKSELEHLARHLGEALTSRASIDQAKGMIMALKGCSADDAFALLAKRSSEHNIKIRDIAERMVAEASAGRPVGGL